jgi:glycosyltransferase involved in cell wall biosynthesis
VAHLKSIKKLVCLQIIPSMGVGGIETGVRDMSSYLTSLKINNYVLAENSSNNLDTNTSNIYFLKKLKFKNIFDQAKIKQLILKIIQEKKINLIHISSRAPAFFLINWIKKQGIKTVTSLHNTYNDQNFLKKYYNSFLLKGDSVISNSYFVSNYFHTNYNIKNQSIHIIPRGINTEYFDSDKKQKIQNKQNIKIFHPSRISSWKGHILFLKYFAKLIKKSDMNFEVTIISNHNNKYEKEVDKIVQNLKISNQVHFIKPTKNIKELYMKANLVINSSVNPEGFGRTICESLSMRTPVIAPNMGGTKEQLEKFDDNLLYEIDNFDSFKKSFYYALKNQDTISEKGRDFVIKNYSSNQMCFALLEIYNGILNEHISN